MATAMRRWIALTGAGLLVVALATLPPAALRVQPRTVLPEVARFDALSAQARREVGVLQAMRWSDSLSQLTLRTAVDGVAYGVFGDQASADAVAAWGGALHDYVDDLRVRDEDLLVGVFLQPAGLGQPRDVPGPSIGGVHTYVGVREGTPYCLQVDPIVTAERVTDALMRSRIQWMSEIGIGRCRLFARYGMPGDHVLRWLEDGAIRFGGSAVPRTERRRVYDEYGRFVPSLPAGSPIFGLFRPEVVDRNPIVGRCLAGHEDACATTLLSAKPDVRFGDADYEYIETHSPLTYNARAGSGSLFNFADQYLLGDLEAEFGTDAFARFWASDEEVPEAFRAAFGVEPGAWMRAWAQQEAGVYEAGPGLDAGAGLASLLTLLALSGVASLVGMRRRVG